jgi:hypothetical protein
MTLVAVSSRSIIKIPSLHISGNLYSSGVSIYKQTGMELGEAEPASISEIVIELID